MCQSLAEGGRRCAAHTRPLYEIAIKTVREAHGFAAVVSAQMNGLDAVVAHAGTPSGGKEVGSLLTEANNTGNTVFADFLATAIDKAGQVEKERVEITNLIATTVNTSAVMDSWDPGTPNVTVGEHWSVSQGGTRWHEGGCGAFAMGIVERWPHLKIAAEMYDDHGAESVAHAWAYDPDTNIRFHIFGAETWEPTTRPDYDPDSHRVLLDQTPDDVRRLFRGFNTSEDHVMDAMDVAVEMFDPDYVADDKYDRNHLYF